MTYTIEYEKKDDGGTKVNFRRNIRRLLVSSVTGWMLKDGNGRNIRSFATIGEAMVWIDEERKGI